MKRVMVFSLTGLLVLALVGLVMADTWYLFSIVPGGDPVSTAIDGSSGSGKIWHRIDSGVDDGANGVIHAGWVRDSEREIFRHNADLVYQTWEVKEQELSLGNATWYAHVNADGTGSSDFQLTYPVD